MYKRHRGLCRILAFMLSLMLLTGCGTAAPDTPSPTELQVPETTAPTVPVTEAPTEPAPTVATEPAPTEPEAITRSGTATITVAGDIMSHLPLVNAGHTGVGYFYDNWFRYVADYVSQADFAVVNLETTFAGTENGNQYSGFPRFNCPDSMADAVKGAGFDMFLTANNHSYDTGVYGFERTLDVIEEKGLLSLGTTRSSDEANYRIVDVNGIQVGMLCYTYGQIDEATGQKSVNGLPMNSSLTDRINVFDYEKRDLFYAEAEQQIAAMESEGAEAVVFFIHWGNEYRKEQNAHQEAIAQQLCNLGVDVIVGGHPHVIQPARLLTSELDSGHRTLCVYSLGNFLSNQRSYNMDMESGHTEDGLLFSFTLVKYSNGEVHLDSASYIPTWVCPRYVNGRRSYDILPLDSAVEDWDTAMELSEFLGSANRSYNRTYAIIGEDMAAISTKLDSIRAEREQALGIFIEGVG